MPAFARARSFLNGLRLCVELVICLTLLVLAFHVLNEWRHKRPGLTITIPPELLDVFRQPTPDMLEHLLIVLHRTIIYIIAALAALHHIGHLCYVFEPTQVFFWWLRVYIQHFLFRNKHAIEIERLQGKLRLEQHLRQMQTRNVADLQEYIRALKAIGFGRADMQLSAHHYSQYEWTVSTHATGLLNSFIRPGQGLLPTNCVICFADYVLGDMVTKLPCGHVFHRDCAETWLKKIFTCPLCQRGLCWRMGVKSEEL